MPVRSVRWVRFVRSLAVAFLLCLATAAFAESARELVAKGNKAQASGDLQAALDAYEQASVELPESPILEYNRGTVYYVQDDLQKARDAFKSAAVKTRDIKLEARCKYNLGNCDFRECDRQKDSDLKKALEACEQSVSHYQEALRLDPEIPNAARNIEVARLTMKTILDALKKQQEQQKQQQQQQQQMAEKLKELAERQQQAAQANQGLQQQQRDPGKSAQAEKGCRQLADEQRDIQKETQSLSDQLAQAQQQQQAQQQGQQQGPQPRSPADQVQEHLRNAAGQQQQAGEKLDRKNLSGAHPNQQKAAEELKKALESMQNQDQQQQQQQQGQDGDNKQDQQQGQQQQQAAKQDDQQQDQEKEKEEAQAAMVPEEARDILDEEKENRDRRPRPTDGYRAVDRDW